MDTSLKRITLAKLPLLLTPLTYIHVGKASAPAHAPYLHPCRQRRQENKVNEGLETANTRHSGACRNPVNRGLSPIVVPYCYVNRF